MPHALDTRWDPTKFGHRASAQNKPIDVTVDSAGNQAPPHMPPRRSCGRLRLFANDIKIHHTVFAMPWAILSAVLAGRLCPGSLTAGKISLIVVCMVTAAHGGDGRKPAH